MRPYASHKMKWAWIIIKERKLKSRSNTEKCVARKNWKHTHTLVNVFQIGSIFTHTLFPFLLFWCVCVCVFFLQTLIRSYIANELLNSSSQQQQQFNIHKRDSCLVEKKNILLRWKYSFKMQLRKREDELSVAHMFFTFMWLSAYVARARRLWSMASFVLLLLLLSLFHFEFYYEFLNLAHRRRRCRRRCFCSEIWLHIQRQMYSFPMQFDFNGIICTRLCVREYVGLWLAPFFPFAAPFFCFFFFLFSHIKYF